MTCLPQSSNPRFFLTLIFTACSLFLFLACSQSDNVDQPESTGSSEYPARTCALKPERRVATLSETQLNLSIDISSNDINDTLRVYKNGELIYECSHVVSDELTGAGDFLNVIIDREGDILRFETEGADEFWEGEIFAEETELYTNFEERTFEYYYAFASFSQERGWSVWLTAEHPGYE